jgi:mono/diheme cytochrome c family protein
MIRTCLFLFTVLAVVAARSVTLATLIISELAPANASSATKSIAATTFNKDVAAILFKNCVQCHRPGETAPMSLLSYKDARPWARSIREKVVKREMPPWHADPHFGEFSNDRRLSQADIDTIVAWVDGGAKEGDPKDLPRQPEFEDAWNIGKPDLILSTPEEFTLKANGPDEYHYFVVDPGFTEDKYVQMAEARPGNRKIVHHINIFVQPPPPPGAPTKELNREQLEKMRFEQEKDSILYREGFLQRLKPDVAVFDDGCNLASGGAGTRRDGSGQRVWPMWLGGYVPGVNGLKWESGMAKRIPAGSKIVLNVHYSGTTGKLETDRSMIGLVFAKEKPKKQLLTQLIANHYFKVPPGVEDHRVTACWTASEDIHLVGAAPHMHYRGKSMEIRAFFPDGVSKVLLNVPAYDFSWQTMYYFKQPVAIPGGTRLQLTARFDNSRKNRSNPDPTQTVRWGDPTYDEMTMSILEYTIDSQSLNPPR